MSAQNNIARPYAQAVFELAQEQNNLAQWDAQLQLLAAVASDHAVLGLTRNPRVSAAQLAEVILAIGAAEAAKAGLKEVGQFTLNAGNDGIKNLVKLLAHNGRIGALGDIARAFTALRSDAEKTVSATMATAVPIDKKQQQQFKAALQTKLGRKVNLAFEVDETLIGGAVIRAGDLVVDGSVRAQLEQLGATLEA